MAASKRKRASVDASKANGHVPSAKRRASSRNISTATAVNPDTSYEVFDAPDATRASPDGDVNPSIVPRANGMRSESPLSDAPEVVEPPKKKGRAGKKKAPPKSEDAKDLLPDADASRSGQVYSQPKQKAKEDDIGDPEADGDEEAGEEEVKEALARPPPVHSDYLPLPWKGRLGYACLNTYLRNSNPPVFSSRTCRIQSILEHRHPLQDPTQPEHATKNRPDRNKPADIELGKRYVEALCIANVKDIIKMVKWNDRYNIKFFRLSSEMFPFASHPEYGYKLAPFASGALAEAGKVIGELGHRVTTHPGQFTQLGSPRQQVIDNAIRDLEYHDEMLSLLKLPEQQNKDAIMVLHMGGMFDGKAETLDRFRKNYANLPQSIKNRLVLENDDMGWSVHDLLPICEELNIPFVLDFHHHNIVFDSSQIREGTKDIMELYPRIKATWDRKGITQKMHYSEPTPAAITPRQRRKHNPRVATLPPCSPDMDLMIEAKDKEQAVFELMRTFKLPGYETFNDVLPYTRNDDNKAAVAAIAKKNRKSKKASADAEESEIELIPDSDVGMGGTEGRVYWPPGMEEWLRPKKREVKKKEPAAKSAAQMKKEATKVQAPTPDVEPEVDEESDDMATPATKKAKAAMRNEARMIATVPKPSPKVAKQSKPKGRPKKLATPESSASDELDQSDLKSEHENEVPMKIKPKAALSRKASGRRAKKSIDYNENDAMELE